MVGRQKLVVPFPNLTHLETSNELSVDTLIICPSQCLLLTAYTDYDCPVLERSEIRLTKRCKCRLRSNIGLVCHQHKAQTGSGSMTVEQPQRHGIAYCRQITAKSVTITNGYNTFHSLSSVHRTFPLLKICAKLGG